mmetsp:Transcript_71155/g.139739  ORF Transcript_71155/g.139739 Transcript_71155/m.139739 type:complete len:80 (-) Transcript_71155:93-332(-)
MGVCGVASSILILYEAGIAAVRAQNTAASATATSAVASSPDTVLSSGASTSTAVGPSDNNRALAKTVKCPEDKITVINS